MLSSGIVGLYGELYQFTFPPTMKKGSLFSTPLRAFLFVDIFDEVHSDWYEMISHCSFDLHFSNNKLYWASFHVFVSHLYIFFGEMSVQVFFPLFDWVVFLVLSCMSCLYILEINTLLVVSFAIILYHSEGFLFTLFIVSFALQKLLSLMRSHLFF